MTSNPKGDAPIVDLSDLEPPEPMQRVLEALSRLEPGCVFVARMPRYPRLLPDKLRKRGGCRWTIEEQADGTAILRLWRIEP